MKGAESYTFVKSPLETLQSELKGNHPDQINYIGDIRYTYFNDKSNQQYD
ncbi:unnamed protein product (macronuclear) [Paramecium tetraurelia]|uniref:Uncharacterized protein n=1 Tax=Paramecium tetraurelia TaxID=5888 RepID=A0EF86_PARTE|nr:uncharacterized protein GSPATT00026300001 [Paramecium tetraurelia]CAK93977.1 unnamed protein product [Paramecium tetraurelia]|eukprot:XP_001461350.1 hypothetical protein (macronuclear) [Paramecium tetraurelia strain d4-2]